MYDCAISLALAAIAAGLDRAGDDRPGSSGRHRRRPHVLDVRPLRRAARAPARTSTTTGRPGASTFDGAGDISSARITTSMVIDGQLQPTAVAGPRPRRAAPAGDLRLGRVRDPAAAGAQGARLLRGRHHRRLRRGHDGRRRRPAARPRPARDRRSTTRPRTPPSASASACASSAFGTSVAQLQQALADLGFYTGPIDGRYSAATIEAVRAFQRELGVPETGRDRRGHAAGDLRPRHRLRRGQRADVDGARRRRPRHRPTTTPPPAAADDGRDHRPPDAHRDTDGAPTTAAGRHRTAEGDDLYAVLVGRSAVLDARRGARHRRLTPPTSPTRGRSRSSPRPTTAFDSSTRRRSTA